MKDNWHGLDATEVARVLGVRPETGLRSDDVKSRLSEFGPNRITRKRQDSAMKLRRSLPTLPS
jgi:hypothetical protein